MKIEKAFDLIIDLMYENKISFVFQKVVANVQEGCVTTQRVRENSLFSSFLYSIANLYLILTSEMD